MVRGSVLGSRDRGEPDIFLTKYSKQFVERARMVKAELTVPIQQIF
jgi:hypothetical protein